MFQRIEWDKLVVGEVYLITYLHNGIYKDSIEEPDSFPFGYSMKGKYKGIVEDAPFPCFDFDYLTPELNKENEGCYFGEDQRYYRLVSQKEKIQSNMERRAVNTFVRRLIGDDCFEW